MLKHINQISEQAFLLDFGSKIDIEVNKFVINFANYILEDKKNIDKLKIINCTPSYNKILIQFNPDLKSKEKILYYLNNIKINNIKYEDKLKTIEIPICYEEEYALDLNEISKKTNLSKDKIIEIHLNTVFHVYMIGFMPGLPFMGNLNKNISIQRKLTPRIKLPKGSVGIVDNLCVIYPNESPGGWNIIGRTPVNLFQKNNQQPLLIKPGNKVKFKKILKKSFENYYIINNE